MQISAWSYLIVLSVLFSRLSPCLSTRCIIFCVQISSSVAMEKEKSQRVLQRLQVSQIFVFWFTGALTNDLSECCWRISIWHIIRSFMYRLLAEIGMRVRGCFVNTGLFYFLSQDQFRERPFNPAFQRGSWSGGCRVHQEPGLEVREGPFTNH